MNNKVEESNEFKEDNRNKKFKMKRKILRISKIQDLAESKNSLSICKIISRI